MDKAVLIDDVLLAQVSAEAVASPRRRKNFNFHAHDAALAHRMLNAIEPGSYLAPHRHCDPNKDETMIVLSGRLGIVLYDDQGAVLRTHVLAAASPVCGITIPHGMFHTAVALLPGTVMFESKAGPYVALSSEERAPWAPAEGDEGVAAYAERLRALFAVA